MQNSKRDWSEKEAEMKRERGRRGERLRVERLQRDIDRHSIMETKRGTERECALSRENSCLRVLMIVTLCRARLLLSGPTTDVAGCAA